MDATACGCGALKIAKCCSLASRYAVRSYPSIDSPSPSAPLSKLTAGRRWSSNDRLVTAPGYRPMLLVSELTLEYSPHIRRVCGRSGGGQRPFALN